MFADGWGKMGNVEELNLPKLSLKMEEYRGGGMDVGVDIDLGMEKLEAEFTLTSFDPQVLSLFGLGPGNDKLFTFRGSLASEDGTKRPVICRMSGLLSEADPGNWKTGDKAELKGKISIKTYKLIIDDRLIHHIDAMNGVRVINGADVTADIRAHLGL
jgi:P2 family phage contractile tail tube protein